MPISRKISRTSVAAIETLEDTNARCSGIELVTSGTGIILFTIEKEIEDVAERMYMLAKEHPGRKRDLPRAGLKIVVGYWACIPLISC